MHDLRPRGHALRKGRYSASGSIYHVTTVTYLRRPIFADLHTGRLAVDTLKRLEERGASLTFAFVVMPDHLHWLFQLGPGMTLPRLIQTLKANCARRINERGNKRGHRIWQAGYHDRAIRSEEELSEIARYIVANPLRAGLVRSVRDYALWDAIWV